MGSLHADALVRSGNRGDMHPAFKVLQDPELGMPDETGWLAEVTYPMMARALQKVDPKYLLRLEPRTHFVDLGSGWGHWSVAAAQAFYEAMHPQPAGGFNPKKPVKDTKVRFVEVDVVPQAMQRAQQVAHEKGLHTLGEPRFIVRDFLAPANQTALLGQIRPGTVGLIILSSMLHMKEADNQALLRLAEKLLMPGGRLLITHWFENYPKRGPQPSLRPTPGKIVRWAFMGPALQDFEYIGYDCLPKDEVDQGMYCVVLQKPKTPKQGKMVFREIDPKGQYLVGQFQAPSGHFREQNFPADRLYRHVFCPIRYLQTPAEIAVFWDGLVERYIMDNPGFAEHVMAQYQTDPAYREYMTQTVQRFQAESQNPSNDFSRACHKTLLASLKPRNTTWEAEIQKLSDPVQFEVRRILFFWLNATAFYASRAGDRQFVDNALRASVPFRIADEREFQFQISVPSPATEDRLRHWDTGGGTTLLDAFLKATTGRSVSQHRAEAEKKKGKKRRKKK